jgi:hypothetical protein
MGWRGGCQWTEVGGLRVEMGEDRGMGGGWCKRVGEKDGGDAGREGCTRKCLRACICMGGALGYMCSSKWLRACICMGGACMQARRHGGGVRS